MTAFEVDAEPYPGIFVRSDTVTGSLRCGGRLPLWAFAYEAIVSDASVMEDDYRSVTHYGFGPEQFAGFVYDILQARDELGVLVATIADGQRREDAGNYPACKWSWLHYKSNRDRLREALDDAYRLIDKYEADDG